MRNNMVLNQTNLTMFQDQSHSQLMSLFLDHETSYRLILGNHLVRWLKTYTA